MAKHFNIPVFLPELACPFQCSYCNQAAISGIKRMPGTMEVKQLIERNLHSFPKGDKEVEIAFFGGNFTGLSPGLQREYLSLAEEYVATTEIKGIRLSTRPDYISKPVLDLLKEYSVTTIELGAQSLDDEVLALSGRGHTAAQVLSAAAQIRDYGFRLGLQMMVGLPGDNFEKSLHTAETIIAAGADETRIYPCLVIRDTALEKEFNSGKFQVSDLQTAVTWVAQLLLLFERAGVRVIRIGLHPSEDFSTGGLVAGPFHPSLKEMVLSEIWKSLFDEYPDWPAASEILVKVPPGQLNFAVGYAASNKKHLLSRFRHIGFTTDASLQHRQFRVEVVKC